MPPLLDDSLEYRLVKFYLSVPLRAPHPPARRAGIVVVSLMNREPLLIRKAAVLGAGVMGAQIAAHFANAGIPALLFDLPAKEGDPNGLVTKAIANLGKLEPAPLGAKDRAAMIEACNYGSDLARLAECDLVVEAIAERLDWKQDLYHRIAPHLPANVIVASNTSGLSLAALSDAMPEALRPRFCGVHFFNPPRYMYLVELIAAPRTDPALLDALETLLTTAVGKGVIRAKDTPNFIANRIGIFSMLATMRHTQAFGLSFDVVDALTGPAIGRAKSATYRTADVVGLDTMAHVVKTMHDTLPDDPWHALFGTPPVLAGLIAQGALGAKTKAGFFRKVGKDIQVLDPAARRLSQGGRRSGAGGRGDPQGQGAGREIRQAPRVPASAGAVPVGHLPRSLPLQRVSPGGDRRERARRRPRHPLGLRLADGTLRDLAGRGLGPRGGVGGRGHRRRQGARQPCRCRRG